MSTFTLKQKRLEQLRTQLYGKQSEIPQKTKLSKKASESIPVTMSSERKTLNSQDNTAHIKKDLMRVIFFTIAALSFQFLIHVALSNHWISLSKYGFNF